ncbi:pantoate--beta-alanine ligase [Inmirania thermothiophila]|uniref:Pantothenate synthetase n=1 Tax=Inmirania thermothiophila TaxID=1750597 RepID=A0A3N1Y214_9GAMM|nr:pantoate--beta-alanine ligase [Inmirania thermothiophila]ROR32875.1 pantothenate synthetase [Inmirania thermothiophila]
MTELVHTRQAVAAQVAAWRAEGLEVGFVPTMGNLHEGHLRLVDRALEMAPRVVVSVFVNPMQFGPGEDYERYPRTLEADLALLEARGAHLLFAPEVAEIYPRPMEETTRVEVPGLSDILCGAFRPGHFVGVATVVAKLLHIVRPDVAVFGRKDYQQLVIIRRMVEDLCIPVRIEGVDTVREPDGLAMSSRNAYLTADERVRAPELHGALAEAAARLRAGEDDFAAVEAAGRARLEAAGMRPDYFAVRRAADLAEPAPGERALVVLAAARLGSARLIDNVVVER